MSAGVIGGFPIVSDFCHGCGEQLLVGNAWMADGCPCNTPLGVNSMNETRWRLLMQLEQQRSHENEASRVLLARVRSLWFTSGITLNTKDAAECLDAIRKHLGNPEHWPDAAPRKEKHLGCEPHA